MTEPSVGRHPHGATVWLAAIVSSGSSEKCDDAVTLSPPLRPTRVLLVDDEPLLLRVLTEILGARATVRTASNAAAALALLDEEAFDLVVCDHHLGFGMTGSELLDGIATRSPATRRYLMSATMRTSAHSFLLKPLDFDAVRGLVAD
jgi:DNA-binding NtrC family response regulator